MTSPFLQELEKRILIIDGAMGTEIQKFQLTLEDYGGKEGCNEYLVLSRPDIIKAVHKSYLEAGADIIETDTFGGTSFKLDEYGMADKVYEVNFKAASIAREIADEYSTPEQPRFVAGSIGPTGFLPSSDDPDLGKITFDELSQAFAEQAKGLTEGGADVILIETSQDILEVKAAVSGIQGYFKDSGKQLPIIAQVTLDTSGRMLLGTDIGAALTILEAMGVNIVGMNCSTGPEHMRGPARYLCENSNLKISCVPNAGLPINEGGHAVYPLDPQNMAKDMNDFVHEYGVNIVGGCCGTTPDHIREIAKAFRTSKPKGRGIKKAHYVSSSMKSVSLEQDPKPLIIGERLNSQGSRKVKRLLLDDDYNALVNIARDQIDSGAHVLDVCVALTERDNEAEMMKTVTKKLAMSVDAPLMFDSTDPKVLETALKTYAGSAIINSINLEGGRQRCDAILPLAKKYGAGVVALTIDEKGMAKTAAHKLEIATRLYEIYVNEYNLEPGSLLIDSLTFTLATGEAEWLNSAVETLNGIRDIKSKLPGVLTTLGLSNVSFGLKPNARKVLNSVFLYHAVKYGLDSAIVNPKDIIPYPSLSKEEKQLAENLIFNKSSNALAEMINYFEDQTESNQDTLAKAEEHLIVEEALHHKILHRIGDGIEELLDEAMEKYSPVEVLNDILLNAMKEVGDKFGSGELILPFVLQSAEVMKRAVNYLEGFLEKKEGSTKATVLLATVYGDVHDIGKNLVKTILSNNGYTVHDIGKQVPVSTILDKAKELNVDAIGLSALLVSTSRQMPICVEELHKHGCNYPVLVGGAAINRDYSYKISMVEDQHYAGGVYYAKDAFEGLDIMDNLSDSSKRANYVQAVTDKALKYAQQTDEQKKQTTVETTTERSKTPVISKLPDAPFWGVKVLSEKDIPLDDVFSFVPQSELFRLSWGGRGKSKDEYQKLIDTEFKPTLEKLKAEIHEKSLFAPKIVYGYFPCQSDGNNLIIFDPVDQQRQIDMFQFPRQKREPFLCLADYFSPIGSAKKDLVALQVVTIGDKASRYCDELNDKGSYTDSYYLHGLAVQTAEAMADYNHKRILKELGMDSNRGERYSLGYPACPELDDQTKFMSLLSVEQNIGVTLTDAFQFVPEQSTSAFIIHHPDAAYYRV